MWIGSALIVVAVLATAAIVLARALDDDQCDDTALTRATELGLRLSDAEEIVSCEWRAGIPDSSGTVIVRTDSPATRQALIDRSGVSEAAPQPGAVVKESEQAYTSTAPNGHILTIVVDEAVESGLLITVYASET